MAVMAATTAAATVVTMAAPITVEKDDAVIYEKETTKLEEA
jgi:hypothetical protein